VRTDLIEPQLIAWFRSVWQSEKGRQTLRKALAAFEQETIRSQPQRRESLQTQMAKIEQQISRGTENLLLAPADLPAARALLAKWRNERDQIQAEMNAAEQSAPIRFDADAIIAELDELEQHLAGDSIPLAKTAFQRVFESVSLYWETVSPRRRELVRAEVIPRFPFSLTMESLILPRKPTLRQRVWPTSPRPSLTNTRDEVRTGKLNCDSVLKNWR
jgi:hypothetical protein